MRRHFYVAGLLSVFVLACFVGRRPEQAKAEEGTIYSCQIKPCYSHPVSGMIEDAGGESGSATGQGMVESILKKKGMLEVTSSGEYYLTFRLSMMDYTSDQDFTVQKWGQGSWKAMPQGVTRQGKDSNGTTADVCIQIPAKKSIVRGSMYVEAMGRDVIFYFYPYAWKKGKPSGMKATIVTEDKAKAAPTPKASRKTAQTSGKSSSSDVTKQPSEQDGLGSGGSQKGTEKRTEPEEKHSGQTGEKGTAQTGTEQSPPIDTTREEDVDPPDGEDIGQGENMDQSIEKNGDGRSLIEAAEGLTLSTGTEMVTEEPEASGATGMTGENTSLENGKGDSGSSLTMLQWIAVLTAAMTISGMFLLLIATLIVKYFLDNRWKWFDND